MLHSTLRFLAGVAAATLPTRVAPTSNTTNVVFRLIKGDDVGPLIESQKCLRRALAGSEPYDQVIFHQGLSAAAQARLEPEAPNLRFVDVSDDFAAVPAAFPKELGEDALGYRHMCSFMTFAWHRVLSSYSFAMRVDDDVCVQRFAEDPFARMRRDGLVYSYGLETLERHDETLATLPSWLSTYAGPQTPSVDTRELVEHMFFTNFFISRVDWWATEDVSTFLSAVADSGGVFAHRWGDAPIQTAALRLFAPADKLARIPMDYLHASTMNRIFSDGTEADGWADGEMLAHPLVVEFAGRELRKLADALTSNASMPNVSSSAPANSTNVTSTEAAHYLVLVWRAEAELAEFDDAERFIEDALSRWAGVPLSSVTAAISPLDDDPSHEGAPRVSSVAEDQHGDAPEFGSGFGSGGTAERAQDLVEVAADILFPTHAEAQASFAAARLELGSSDKLLRYLVQSGLPPSSVASNPQMELDIRYPDAQEDKLPKLPLPSGSSAAAPSFPPAPPPTQYEPLPEDKSGLDVDAGPFMAFAAAAMFGLVLLALIFLRIKRQPLECGVVSHGRLASAMLHWGLTATRFRSASVSAVAITFAVLAGLGLPLVEQDVGTASSWVPAGGRLERQLKDWEDLVDKSVTDRSYAYFLVSSDDGENLLDDPLRWLDATLRVAKRAYAEANVEVQLDATEEPLQLGWKDFCLSINHPILTKAIPPLTTGTGDDWKPCINPSPLDPFREQSWEFNASDGTVVGREKAASYQAIANVGATACKISSDGSYCGQVNNISGFPSMYDLDRDALVEQLMKNSNEAGHWIAAASNPWGKLYGSYKGSNDASGERALTHVTSFVYNLYQDIPKEVVKHRKSVERLTPEQFRDANERWLLELERVLEQIDADEANFPGVSVVYYPSDAIDRMYEQVASAQTSTIAIGYGVMLAFVVLSQLSWRRYTNFALLGVLGFVAILFANAASYGLIALCGYKYNHTMLQALPFLALGLGVDDLFLLLHAFKSSMRNHRGARAEVVVGLTMMEAGSSITITSLCNAAVFFVACLVPISALRALLVSAGTIVLFNWICSMTLLPALLSVWAARFETAQMRNTTTVDAIRSAAERNASGTSKLKSGDASDEGECGVAELIAAFYTWFSQSLPAKLAFLAVGLAALVGLACLIPKVEVGYNEADLAQKGSYLARGINAMHDQVFSQHSAELVVFGTGVDYTRDQKRILDTHQRLKDSKWSAYGTALGRSGASANTWLTNMYQSTGVCPLWNLYNDSVDPGFAFYEDYHLWRKPQVFLEPRYPPGINSLSFGGLFAGLLDGVNSFAYSSPDGPDDYSDDNLILLSWDQVEMDMTKLQTTEAKLAMLRDFKKITRDSGLNIYMHGWMFVQMEQFLELDRHFWQAAGVSMLVVFAVSLLLGMSWCSAALIAAFAVALCVQVYGSLYLFDISYQTLACTSMLMSIGIAVEFVAHPVAAFEFAVGTRRERLAEAMRRTALPVLEGAVSSFLGFSFLAASDFEFVTKYFFNIFLSICVFGTLNALIFLPAILGLVGAGKDEDDVRASAAESVRRSGAEVAQRKSGPASLEAGDKPISASQAKAQPGAAGEPGLIAQALV